MQDYKVVDFGAKGDGITLDTLAIQNAIDVCSAQGGGRVIFDSKKVFRCGAIVLKEHVELHLKRDSMLKASDTLSDFDLIESKEIKEVKTPTWENCEYSGQPTKFFIYAKSCKDISITGQGRIDGNEHIFYGTVTKWHIDGYFYPRIPLIYLEDCKNILLKDITLQNSAFWTVHLVGCVDVKITHIQIYNNLRLANCDGIDPDHCKNVLIEDCIIESADDCIVFKTTEGAASYGALENVVVRNCKLMSTSAAIKFGTESVSDFRDITITDCKIIQSNRGISIQLRDKGNIEQVVFKNIQIETRLFSPVHWWGKAEPIAITAVRRKEDTLVGTVSNIRFENITMHTENGIFIYGDESINISDIKFIDMKLTLEEKTNWKRNFHDLRPTYFEGIIETPLSDFYIKNAKEIEVSNFKSNVKGNMKSYYKKENYIEGKDIQFLK